MDEIDHKKTKTSMKKNLWSNQFEKTRAVTLNPLVQRVQQQIKMRQLALIDFHWL